jgi:hypothetical protein
MVLLVACGSLVERGADPHKIFPTSMIVLKGVLDMSFKHLQNAVNKRKVSGNEVMSIIDQYSQINREAGAYWMVLNQIYPFFAALFSNAKDLRAEARKDPTLLKQAQILSQFFDGASWIEKILSVLDDEQILVIEPVKKRGYWVKISGIADNHQLQVLLNDVIIGDPNRGFLEGTKNPPNVVACFKNQNIPGLVAQGAFRMVNWEGLQSNGTLPDGIMGELKQNELLIYGELLPIDIHKFEGTRIILLGTTQINRSWNATRLFLHMPAELHLEKILTVEEVNQWINKIITKNASNIKENSERVNDSSWNNENINFKYGN